MTCERRAGPAIVVPLAGEIDLTNRQQAYDRLYAAFVSGAPIVIADLTGMTFCDCGSMRRLLAVQQRAAARGGQLRLVIPPASPVRRVADLTGLDHRLRIYSTVCEAAAWVPQPSVSLEAT